VAPFFVVEAQKRNEKDPQRNTALSRSTPQLERAIEITGSDRAHEQKTKKKG